MWVHKPGKCEYRPNHECITHPHSTSWTLIWATADTVKAVQVCAVLVDLMLHTQMCMVHAPPPCFIFSYLLWFLYWDQVRSLTGKSEASYGELCVHTLLKGCGTPHPSSSPLSSSEKYIIKSLLPEIMKGWDAVSTPGKHGVWLRWGGQLCEQLVSNL